MEARKFNFVPHIGMRNIKTAFAATLCALLYFFIHRNPTFACIGAIFGTGSDVDNSKLNGGNRLFGTIFGGLIGMALFYLYIQFYPDGKTHLPILICVFIGTVLLIITSLFFGWPGAIQPGGVIMCIILFNTPVETYISYSLNRIFDTAVGVVIAIGLNMILPRHRVVKGLGKIGIQLDESGTP